MKQNILLAILVSTLVFLFGCGSTPESGVVSCEANDDTPTAAYKRLYDAVKSKDTEAIKSQMTEATIQFASGVSQRNNTPLEKVFENGFTGSTFSPTLPEIRDERVNCNMGGIEAWNPQAQVWDDLPFMLENGKWKLAVGDLFKGTFKSPGKGMAIREAEAANAARGNVAPPASNVNVNANKFIRMTPPNAANNNSAKVK
ncbi:MAG: hypothetical protein ACRD6X_03640 [Pyrinomonadaceae bacterium]